MTFEYIYLDDQLAAAYKLPAGITTVQRVTAYFMDAQTPEANPLPTPGVCNNLEATKGWPTYVGMPHTDLDMGTLTVTGANKAGATVTTTLDKMGPGTDAIGRKHDIFYQKIQPVADNYIAPDHSYTIDIGGAGSIAATSLKDAVFLAGDFTVSQPGLNEDTPFTAGTDATVKWTVGTSANLPKGDDVLGVTWLVDTNGAPTHMCPTAHSAGQFTIPGSAITEYKQIATARGTDPTHMVLLRNAIVHHVLRLPNGEPNNKRRFDAVSLLCWAQLIPVN